MLQSSLKWKTYSHAPSVLKHFRIHEHCLCEHCLRKFVKSERDKALEKKNEEFNCPFCRSPFSLKPNEDVANLSCSHLIRNMLDVVSVQSRAKSKATKCSKIQCEKHAIAHCMKCELFMCETCLEFHGSWPAFAKHTVLSMSELTKAASKNHAMLRGKPRCSKHESKVLKFYCQTCEKLVCRYCMDFDHAKQNHPCIPAEDVANEKTQSFKTSVDSIEDNLKRGSDWLNGPIWFVVFIVVLLVAAFVGCVVSFMAVLLLDSPFGLMVGCVVGCFVFSMVLYTLIEWLVD